MEQRSDGPVAVGGRAEADAHSARRRHLLAQEPQTVNQLRDLIVDEHGERNPYQRNQRIRLQVGVRAAATREEQPRA